MISHSVFTNIIKRFANCCDRQVKIEQVNELYERLKFSDEAEFASAIERMILSESKLTLPAIKLAMKELKKNYSSEPKSSRHFNGVGCPNCDMGLIFTTRKENQGIPYRFVYRCKCGAYDAPTIPIWSGPTLDEVRI